ncbi:MAG: pilus assembly protein CpaF [Halioglobus sp.]
MTRIVISNMFLGGSEELELEKDELLVGSQPDSDLPEEQPDLLIRSRQVATKHALLNKKGDVWHITHRAVGFETIVNGTSLAYGEERVLEDSDLVYIGEYLLRLLNETQSLEGPSTGENAKVIMALENDIHSQLLDLMDLRQSKVEINLGSDSTKLKIRNHLEDLVKQAVDGLKDDLKRELVQIAMYKRLTNEITLAGSAGDTKRRHAEFEQPFFESQLEDITRRILSSLDVVLEAKTMKEDIQKLDATFKETLQRYEIDFSEGLQDYVSGMFFMRNILDLIFGLGPLQDLLDTPTISEIMVVSKDRIFVEKFGVVEDSRREFYSDVLLMSVIERIVAPVGRRIDKSNPLVDARLKDGSRVNAIIPPLALKGPCLTIRKFSETSVTIHDLVKFGALSEEMVQFLKACVDNHLNIVVSGGTGSGKTTMLNCLSAFISPAERVVTVEDTAELQMKQDHVVTLETRPPNMEGKGEVTIRDLIKNALRMRPDRIVVGECRGGETLDMLQAMNTGHDGSMTTGHANTPQDMMKRLETMVLTGMDMPVDAIRIQITSAVHLVVQLNRFSDGARRVTHISEVAGRDDITGHIIVEDIFRYIEAPGSKTGRQLYTGYIPSFLPELLDKNLITLEQLF